MHQQRIQVLWIVSFLFLLFLVVGRSFAAAEEKKSESLFAIVDGYEITEAVFLTAVQREADRRYYHGRLTEERLLALKQDVARSLIDTVLLIHEAEKQGLQVDSSKLALEVARFDERYAESPDWQKDRERVLPDLKRQLESRELVSMIESKVRADVVLTEALKHEFYTKNPELFILPERRKVSLILIKVSPSASSEVWNEARELLNSLAKRMVAGEVFSELAEVYSDDRTASEGGNMGYQHKGMLHDDVEEALDALEVGGVSPPIRLLQGYALVRLEEVVPAQKISYEDSEKQVVELLSRELSNNRWDEFLDELRRNARVIRF